MKYEFQKINFSISSVMLFAAILIFPYSCSKGPTAPVPTPTPTPTPTNADKAITSFVFKTADNPNILTTDVAAIISSDSIKVVFAQGTVIKSLIPTVTFTGKTLSPQSKAAQNFDSTKNYIVTAKDGSTKTYTVYVTFVSSDKNITSFIFRSVDNSPNLGMDINGVISADSINLTLPAGTKITSLIPYITITGKTVSPASLLAQDFTNPVKYTVIASDGSTKSYDVNVKMTFFSIAGTIFVPGETDNGISSTGNVFAIDAATGQAKWIYSDPRGIVSAPTVSNGIVYDASKNGNFFALDVNSGNLVWKYSTGPNNQIPFNPTVVNGIFYDGSGDSSFYAINASNGTLLWKINTGALRSCSPTVSNGVVYFIGDSLCAVNSVTGSVIWKSQLSTDTSAVYPSNPAVVNGILYIGCSDRNLYAVDVTTGAIRWKYFSGDVIDSSPTVANGMVYFTGGLSSVYALDAGTGALKWSYYNTFQIISSPTVANGILYFGSQDKNLYALDANTGVVKWTYQTDYFLVYSPLYFSGAIFISSYDELYSINAATGNLIWKYFYTRSYDLINPCALDLSGNVYHTSESGDQN